MTTNSFLWGRTMVLYIYTYTNVLYTVWSKFSYNSRTAYRAIFLVIIFLDMYHKFQTFETDSISKCPCSSHCSYVLDPPCIRQVIKVKCCTSPVCGGKHDLRLYFKSYKSKWYQVNARAMNCNLRFKMKKKKNLISCGDSN